jgi:membrane fusion protein (multidrug efflux system)
LLTKKFGNALLIPQKSTFEVLDKKFVYVINAKNEVESREIKIAAEVPHLFIVGSGLTDSDKILVEGVGKVHAGEVIKTENLDRAAVIKSLELSTK